MSPHLCYVFPTPTFWYSYYYAYCAYDYSLDRIPIENVRDNIVRCKYVENRIFDLVQLQISVINAWTRGG